MYIHNLWLFVHKLNQCSFNPYWKDIVHNNDWKMIQVFWSDWKTLLSTLDIRIPLQAPKTVVSPFGSWTYSGQLVVWWVVQYNWHLELNDMKRKYPIAWKNPSILKIMYLHGPCWRVTDTLCRCRVCSDIFKPILSFLFVLSMFCSNLWPSWVNTSLR